MSIPDQGYAFLVAPQTAARPMTAMHDKTREIHFLFLAHSQSGGPVSRRNPGGSTGRAITLVLGSKNHLTLASIRTKPNKDRGSTVEPCQSS